MRRFAVGCLRWIVFAVMMMLFRVVSISEESGDRRTLDESGSTLAGGRRCRRRCVHRMDDGRRAAAFPLEMENGQMVEGGFSSMMGGGGGGAGFVVRIVVAGIVKILLQRDEYFFGSVCLGFAFNDGRRQQWSIVCEWSTVIDHIL